MYFKYFKNMNYNFSGNDQDFSYEMKDIFSRPVLETTGFDYSRIDNNETPDQSAKTLYGDNSLFYINLLLNNTLNKNDWPLNELDFTEKLNDSYKGYAFHILEKPCSELRRGDVIITTNDLAVAKNDPTCTNDPGCYPTYAIIEKWDPTLRKIWVREYTFGNVSGATDTVGELFKENNTFKIFHRNDEGKIDIDSVELCNINAWIENGTELDPNYTPAQETPPPVTHTVLLQNNEFVPSTLTGVKAGDTVKWEWVDGLHNVISGTCSTSDGLFASDTSPVPGTIFTWDVPIDQEVGDIEYVCKLHCITPSGGMVGTITIEESSGSDGTYRTFKMKQVHPYLTSVINFEFYGRTTFTVLNSYMKNLSESYDINSYVGEYNAGNTNGTCSLIDAYILQANGQTGSDDERFVVDTRISSKELKQNLIEENEEKRYVNFLKKPLVGNVVEALKREYNAS